MAEGRDLRREPLPRTRAGSGRMLAVIAAGCAAALMIAAGCGGSDSGSDSDSTTTERATTDAPDATTTTSSGVSQRAMELALLLPDEDAIADLGEGNLTELSDAETLVNELYSEGDPARDAAVERFEDGGYDLGVLRDQIRFGSGEGPQLVRSYVVGFATSDAAQTEVGESITEVKRSSSAPSTDVPVPGIPGAEAVSLQLEAGTGETADVLFVTFSAGRFLYGIQVFGEAGGAVDRATILAAAQDAYDAAPGP